MLLKGFILCLRVDFKKDIWIKYVLVSTIFYRLLHSLVPQRPTADIRQVSVIPNSEDCRGPRVKCHIELAY